MRPIDQNSAKPLRLLLAGGFLLLFLTAIEYAYGQDSASEAATRALGERLGASMLRGGNGINVQDPYKAENQAEFNKNAGVEYAHGSESPQQKNTFKTTIGINSSLPVSCSYSGTPVERSLSGVVMRLGEARLTVGQTGVRTCEISAVACIPLAGENCTDTDWQPVVLSTNPTNVQGDGGEVSLSVSNCDAAGKCTLTVAGKQVIGGNVKKLKETGSAQAEKYSESGPIGTAANLASTPEYAEAYHDPLGGEARDCNAMNRKRALAGQTLLACDGSGRQIELGVTKTSEAANTQQCGMDKCVERTVREYSAITECRRQIPVTEWHCKWNIPHDICVFEYDKQGVFVSDSCTPGHRGDGREYAKIDCLEFHKAINQETKKEESTGVCKYEQRVTLFHGEKTLEGDCVATPYELDGGVAWCAFGGEGVMMACEQYILRTSEECSVSYADGEGTPVTAYLTEHEKKGCGFCIKPVQHDYCRAKAPIIESDSCAFVGGKSKCVSLGSDCASGMGYLCQTQRESYNCTYQEEFCSRYDPASNCAATNFQPAKGTDKPLVQSTGGSGLAEAMVGVAMLNNAQKSAESGDPQANFYLPLIFGGEVGKCEKPVGLYGAIRPNCCKANLGRDAMCEEDEKKLAAAKRAKRTHYVGEYCSKRIGFVHKICIKKKESYCVFPSVLSRVVQQQGRKQLEAMAGSNPDFVSQQLDFPYYNPFGVNGAWRTFRIATSPETTVMAWMWPSECKNHLANQKGAVNPEAFCPDGPEVYFAVCSATEGDLCREGPEDPLSPAMGWVIGAVDALKPESTYVSGLLSVAGVCNTSSRNCSYSAKAYPQGRYMFANVRTRVTWPLYAESVLELTPTGLKGLPEQMDSMGDVILIPQLPKPGTHPLPSAIPLLVSKNFGKSWDVWQLPTTITRALTLDPGISLVAEGGCNAQTQSCEYGFSGRVRVDAKPWRSPKSPDCSGFTPGQFAVLDFNRMDLHEFLETMNKDIGTVDESTLARSITAQINAFQTSGERELAVSGQPSVTSQGQTVMLSTREGWGPFLLWARISGNYPEYYEDPAKNDNPVSSVTIDWGDGSPQSIATMRILPGYTPPAPSNKARLSPAELATYNKNETSRYAMANNVGMFELSHTYPALDTLYSKAALEGASGVDHTMTVTIHAAKGTYAKTFVIHNVWQEFREVNGAGESGLRNGGKAP